MFFCLTLIISLSYAQESSPITITDGKYYHNDVLIKKNKEIKTIVANVPDAYKEVKKGCGRNTTGIIFGGLGGAMLGTSLADAVLGTTFYSDDPTTGIIVGAICLGTGIWLSISGAKNISKGVEIYNYSFDTGYKIKDLMLNFGAAPHGIGFTCTF